MNKFLLAIAAAGTATACVGPTPPAMAQISDAAIEHTYADLVDLALPAAAVIHARVDKQAELEAERAPNVRSGFTRLYVEAETLALLSGDSPIGESLRYLVDVPLDARGKAPRLKDREVLLFTRSVQGRPGEIALVGPHAQLDWTPALESRLRPILAEIAAPDTPPQITSVNEALSVQGNLAGESETQFFLDTDSGMPVSITVVRRPGMSPVWGVSWSEIVDQAASPPRADSIAWYRLACSLPDTLPGGVNLSSDGESQAQANADYRFVLDALGPCTRYRDGNRS